VGPVNESSCLRFKKRENCILLAINIILGYCLVHLDLICPVLFKKQISLVRDMSLEELPLKLEFCNHRVNLQVSYCQTVVLRHEHFEEDYYSYGS